MDADLLLAIQLQEQFDSEVSFVPPTPSEVPFIGHTSKKRKVEVTAGDGSDVDPGWRPERPLSIVDESWEILDPNPDVRAMFLEFNNRFFWGKLSCVEVKWSPRMTLCAGICSYEGQGGLCSIRLSEPLLKLRPRKDLVQTLLHEMIHALLFVTKNNRDRDGHGPEFCKHMNRINTASGTSITVYHSFHDEVNVYRQHWWRCSGPCQDRRPYFGYVKRAMNRAPSSLDPWWGDHQRSCGGTYTKVKEPEGYGQKGKKKEKNAGSGSHDIRSVVPFSGKGFLLGETLQNQKAPDVPTSFFPFSSSQKTLGSPVPSPPAPKPPVKRSVSNTRAFVNVNGSPVRIQRPTPNIPQKSIEQLFRKMTSPSLNASPMTSCVTQKQPSQHKPEKLTHSKYFGQSGIANNGVANNNASGTATSRKRSWDKSIIDFFQKPSDAKPEASSSSSSSSSSSFPPSAAGQHSHASSSSSSLPAVMVSCPVCQTKVQDAKINEHLDSCLS
ncbi:DNA-dependent metalloprotease SPRTN isoform X2 [Gouania willdenowi]|uniref:DNA-dependent metalloprotease SPRTN isoform X2 n=1 Tax=Gouania willdenowi TaxID=441366 RepID=UPI0010563FC3|nr:sprT-like domain-containing protein Spartan isoform X2 [Gouania willdenowi]